MKKQPTAEILKLVPLFLTGITFATSTVLFLLFVINPRKQGLMEIGFWFTGIGIIINMLTFISLMTGAYFYKEQQEAITKNTMALLLNIPVTILYITILTQFI